MIVATTTQLRRAVWESPFGRAYLLAGADGLLRLEFRREQPDCWATWAVRWFGKAVEIIDGPLAGADAIVGQAMAELDAFASGQVCDLTTPLDLRGTPFQQSVWATVRGVPYGQTRSYGQIADQIGRPKAVRATGAANGANPLSIYVPCHRIIGADGSLRDYGGGLEIKAALLAMESARAHVAPAAGQASG